MLQKFALRLWLPLRYAEPPVGFINRLYAKDSSCGDKNKPKSSCKRSAQKKKCTKIPAPLPSFSECKKNPTPPKNPSECDCLKLDK